MINTKKLQIYLGVVGLFLIVIGVSYSLFTANYIGYVKQKIAVGEDMIFSYVETDNTLNLTEKDILSIENGKTSTNYFDFSVSLKSDSLKNVDYYIYLTKDETSTLDEQYIYTYLTNQNNEEIAEATKINELLPVGENNDSYGIYGTNIESNNKEKVEHNYRLRVWIDENYEISYTTKDEGDDHTLTKVPKTYKFKVNVATGTLEPPQSEGNLASNWVSKTSNEKNYLAIYTYNRKDLPSTYKYNNETYTLDTTIDVSEQSNGNVILGEYKNGSNMIAVIGQDGKVMAPANCTYLFLDLYNLTILDLNKFNTQNVINMTGMFQNCNKLTSLKLNNFDTSNVTNMYVMFWYCASLKVLDISSFDTSKVTTMEDMFKDCSSLITIIAGCDWKLAKTTTNMFYKASITSVTSVCTSPKATLANVWQNYTENEKNYLALYTLNTKMLPNTYTYNNETYTLNRKIDVSERQNETVFLGEYTNGDNIVAVIGQDGKVMAPENCTYLFLDLYNLTILDLTYFDTSRTTIMREMIQNCNKLTSLDLTSFDTSKVTNMFRMFWYCSSLRVLDITTFDTNNVTTMEDMFKDCSSLITIIAGCDWKLAQTTTNMFTNASVSSVTNVCTSPTGTLANVWQNYTENEKNYLALYTLNTKVLPETYSYNETTYTLNKTIDVSERQNKTVMLGEYKNGNNIIAVIGQDGKVMAPENCTYLFLDLYNLTILDLTYFDTSRTTIMREMIQNCNKLTSLDLTSFDTSKVTNMFRMFWACSSLTSLNVTSFDTSEVTLMEDMFKDCSKLTTLDLSSFNTRKVTNMNYMFQGCTKLTEIKTGCNWVIGTSTTTTNMFYQAGTSSVTKVCND